MKLWRDRCRITRMNFYTHGVMTKVPNSLLISTKIYPLAHLWQTFIVSCFTSIRDSVNRRSSSFVSRWNKGHVQTRNRFFYLRRAVTERYIYDYFTYLKLGNHRARTEEFDFFFIPVTSSVKKIPIGFPDGITCTLSSKTLCSSVYTWIILV